MKLLKFCFAVVDFMTNKVVTVFLNVSVS